MADRIDRTEDLNEIKDALRMHGFDDYERHDDGLTVEDIIKEVREQQKERQETDETQDAKDSEPAAQADGSAPPEPTYGESEERRETAVIEPGQDEKKLGEDISGMNDEYKEAAAADETLPQENENENKAFDIDIDAAQARIDTVSGTAYFMDSDGGGDEEVFETMRIDRGKLDEYFGENDAEDDRGGLFAAIASLFHHGKKADDSNKADKATPEKDAAQPEQAPPHEPEQTDPETFPAQSEQALQADLSQTRSIPTVQADENRQTDGSAIAEEEELYAQAVKKTSYAVASLFVDGPTAAENEPREQDVTEAETDENAPTQAVDAPALQEAAGSEEVRQEGREQDEAEPAGLPGQEAQPAEDSSAVLEKINSGLSRLRLRAAGAVLLFCAMIYMSFFGYADSALILTLMFAALCACAWEELWDGVLCFKAMRANEYSVLVFSAAVTLVHSLLQLKAVSDGAGFVFYGTVSGAGIIAALAAKTAAVSKTASDAKKLNAAKEYMSVGIVDDEELTQELFRQNTQDGEKAHTVLHRIVKQGLSNYDDRLFSSYTTENFLNYAAPVAVGGTLLLTAIALLILRDTSDIISIFAALAVSAVPVSVGMLSYLPFLVASSKTSSNGGIISSPDNADDVRGCDGVVLRDGELFPQGTIILKGIRIFNDYPIGDVLSYTASLLNETKCALGEVFINTVQSDEKLLVPVESWDFYENLGIKSVICGKQFDIGNYDFITACGVALPKSLKGSFGAGNYPLFAACDGEIACVFAVHYDIDEDTRIHVRAFSDSDITMFLLSPDMNINEEDLTERFSVGDGKFRQISRKCYDDLTASEKKVCTPSGLYTLNDSLRAFESVIAACRGLFSSIKRNNIICAAAMAASPLYIFALILMGGIAQATPMNILIMLIIWLIPFAVNSFII